MAKKKILYCKLTFVSLCTYWKIVSIINVNYDNKSTSQLRVLKFSVRSSQGIRTSGI